MYLFREPLDQFAGAGDALNGALDLSDPAQVLSRLELLCAAANTLLTEDGLGAIDLDVFLSLLQRGLAHSNHLTKKRGLYLLKRFVAVASKCPDKAQSRLAHSASFRQGAGQWSDFFLALECVDEKQPHIVKQIAGKLKSFLAKQTERVDERKPLHASWTCLLFRLLFRHNTASIVEWSLNFFLSNLSPGNVVGGNDSAVTDLLRNDLLPAMDDSKIYGRNEKGVIEIQENFERFLSDLSESVSDLEEKQTFWQGILRSVTLLSWGPIPLFHVTQSLHSVISKEQDMSGLMSEEVARELVHFSSQKLRNQDPLLKGGTQEYLLRMIMRGTPSPEVSISGTNSPKLVDDILLCFKTILYPTSKLWDLVRCWLFPEKLSVEFEAIEAELKEIAKLSDVDTKLGRIDRLARLWALTSGTAETFCQSESWPKLLGAVIDLANRPYCSRSLEIFLLIEAVFQAFSLPPRRSGRESFLVYGSRRPEIDPHEVLTKCAQAFFAGREGGASSVDHLIQALSTVFGELTHLPPLEVLNRLLNVFDLLPRTGYSVLCPKKQSLRDYSPLEKVLCLSFLGRESRIGRKGPRECLFYDEAFQLDEDLITEDLFNCASKQTLLKEMNLYQEQFYCDQWSVNSDAELRQNKSNSFCHGFDFGKVIALLSEAASRAGPNSLPQITGFFRVLVNAEDREVPINAPIRMTDQIRNSSGEIGDLLSFLLSLIFDFRRNEAFWPCLKAFVDAAFSLPLLVEPKLAKTISSIFDRLFEEADCVSGIVALVSEKLANIADESKDTYPNLEQFTARLLTHGYLYRKNLKISFEANLNVQKLGNDLSVNLFEGSEHNCDTIVRLNGLRMLQSYGPDDMNLDLLFEALIAIDRRVTGEKTRYFENSLIHLTKQRALQAMLCMTSFCSEELAIRMSKFVLKGIVSDNQQTSVRYFSEWIVQRLLSRFASEILLLVDECYQEARTNRLNVIPAFLSIYCHSAGHFRDEDTILNLLAPWCMSQNFGTRLTAQLCFKKVVARSAKHGGNKDSKFNFVLECIESCLTQGNVERNQAKINEDFFLTAYDPAENFRLRDIFFHFPRLSGVIPQEWEGFDSCFQGPFSTWIESSHPNSSLEARPTPPQPVFNKGQDSASEDSVLQRKITPWESMFQNESSQTKSEPAFPGLCLVASLVDKTPNLGGLCRTCEILGVGEYVVNSLKVTEERDFTTLSVTAQNWVPMTEVPVEKLKAFMDQRRSEGYTIVGVEQTSKSEVLGRYEFPERTLLLLGNEKEGIPVELIDCVDVCLEIPQNGVVRSFNVHVTGALVLWEYAKQFSAS